MRRFVLIGLFAALLSGGCSRHETKKTVYAVPVYGQSLALGEEAELVTDFDSLVRYCGHRVVTQNLDERFGFFSNTRLKQWVKSVINYHHRMFELSIYGMAESIFERWDADGVGRDYMLCTFPGGQGAASILELGRGSAPYEKFLSEVRIAYKRSRARGWEFEVPAICWMQGENDVVWQLPEDYKKSLKEFRTDVDADIRAITGQVRPVVIICYQSNCVTLSKSYEASAFECPELMVPNAQLELIRDDSLFVASGPTYPYNFARQWVHLDGTSQKRLGHLAGLSLCRLMQGRQSDGLVPAGAQVDGNCVTVAFDVPFLPLVIDTVAVQPVKNAGFSVVDSMRRDILERVVVSGSNLILYCAGSPSGCKVRYAVNGLRGEGGSRLCSRGNLRDSQGDGEFVDIRGRKYPLHNWCYQFEIALK